MTYLKTCSKCGASKRQAQFYRNGSTKDGLNSWCKACHSASDRKRYNEKRKHKNGYACDYARQRGTLYICPLSGRSAQWPGLLGCKRGDRGKCARVHSWHELVKPGPSRD